MTTLFLRDSLVFYDAAGEKTMRDAILSSQKSGVQVSIISQPTMWVTAIFG